MKKYLFQKNGNLFYENRLIYFSDSDETESFSKENSEESPEVAPDTEGKHKEQKAVSEKNTGKIQKEVMERYENLQLFFDKYEYELPPDIDPSRLSKARELVDKAIIDLNQDNATIAGSIDEFVKKFSVKNRSAKQKISEVLYRNVPEYGAEDLLNKNYTEAPKIDSLKLVDELNTVLSKESGYAGTSTELEEFAKAHFVPKLKEIAKKEWEILKTAYTVKEFMWDVHDKIKPKLIEERAKKEISRYIGFPLKKGLMLEGFGIRGVPVDKDSYQIEQYTQKWKVRDIYMNKEIDAESSDKKMRFNGIWVEIEEPDTGNWERMPMHRLKNFIEAHDIKPVLYSIENLDEVVPYLSHMGVKLESGMKIEYDELTRDDKTGKAIPRPCTVTIISLSDSGVKLDRKVTYRSKYDSPDLADHEMKDEMTLSEFAKWLNMREPLPLMSASELQNKLEMHHASMVKEYGLLPDCHRPIRLEPGEVICADAPGNPLYRIESLSPEAGGSLVLRAGGQERVYTFPEFLRWVHQYGIEPYDPELQARRARRYLGASKKDLPGIRDKAKQAIEYLNKTDNWRNILDKMSQEGVKDFYVPDEDIIQQPHAIEASTPSRSGLREFLRNTQWLCLDDIYQLFKSCWEYYVHDWQTKQKYRYSSVGKNIPWFGKEFERINQSAESENVNRFKESMNEWSVWAVEETLYQSKNKDQAKACLITLSEKGMMRWEDPRLWATLNRFSDSQRKIPIPAIGEDPYHPYKKGAGKFLGQDVGGKTGIDFIPEVIDSIWGEQTYISWRRQNDGSVEDGIQKAYNKGMELENDPYNTGGLSAELASLLSKHMNNQYVDSQEFEGLLRFMIESGKGSHEDRIYYLLMGTNIKNSQGRTIMGWGRMGTFISKLGNNFPVLDYFTDKGLKRDPKNPKKMINRAWIRSDFDEFTQEWARTAKEDGYRPSAGVREYLWKEALNSQAFQERLEKAIRNAENIDHDDTPLFIPALKEDEVESVTSNTGGNKRKFSIPGYKNSYVGFGTRVKYLMKKLAHERDLKRRGYPAFEKPCLNRITDVLRSFVRYDAVLDSRYLKNQGNKLQRLSDADYRTPCAFDPLNPIGKHQKEMQNLIGEILKKYNVADTDEFRYIFTRPEGLSKNIQTKAENDIKLFGRRFYDLISRDKGEKMLQVIDEALQEGRIKGLEGGPATAEEMARRKIQMEMMEQQKNS